ncbi:hypothetical protein BN77_2535 [Rhizobium mesoamericanum STM3625]|uniref:Uncharacterized protein n=1 Tax=Rhizobium mesoamericanum STM3625 TaxID=1211777 RepID=K0PVY9_9HYPH|nr:hypothetical protein BN77_2535 [Rhizobium mesoamericanum STM3625]
MGANGPGTASAEAANHDLTDRMLVALQGSGTEFDWEFNEEAVHRFTRPEILAPFGNDVRGYC